MGVVPGLVEGQHLLPPLLRRDLRDQVSRPVAEPGPDRLKARLRQGKVPQARIHRRVQIRQRVQHRAVHIPQYAPISHCFASLCVLFPL